MSDPLKLHENVLRAVERDQARAGRVLQWRVNSGPPEAAESEPAASRESQGGTLTALTGFR